jgi:hypothetical protein
MQPQSHRSTVPGPAGVHAPKPTPAPRRRRVSAPLDLSSVLTDLSATVGRIRVLQQLHVDDDGLATQLRCAAAELESLITGLLHADGFGSGPPPIPRSSVSTPRRRAVEQACLIWLADPSSADELMLADGDQPVPLGRALGELSLSERPLPAETAASIGLPDGNTFGHVAAELLLAVKDPAGPRCRSFRAAVFYLRDLDRGRLETADASVCR